MTLEEVLSFADKIKPNAFPAFVKTQWINEAESRVQTQILRIKPEDIEVYKWDEDKDTELIVKPPHHKLYLSYLSAMIDFANGEFDRYNNGITLYNSHFSEYSRWFSRFKDRGVNR